MSVCMRICLLAFVAYAVRLFCRMSLHAHHRQTEHTHRERLLVETLLGLVWLRNVVNANTIFACARQQTVEQHRDRGPDRPTRVESRCSFSARLKRRVKYLFENLHKSTTRSFMRNGDDDDDGSRRCAVVALSRRLPLLWVVRSWFVPVMCWPKNALLFRIHFGMFTGLEQFYILHLSHIWLRYRTCNIIFKRTLYFNAICLVNTWHVKLQTIVFFFLHCA